MKVLRGFLFVFISLIFIPSYATEGNDFIWGLERIASSPMQTVNLDAAGLGRIGEISTSSARSLLDIQRKLELINGVHAPIYITGGQFINAFASESPGQAPYILFTLGMMTRFGDDPDLMAAVLAHEMAHLHQHHVLNKIVRQNAINSIGLILGAIIDAKTKNNFQARNVDRFAVNTITQLTTMKFTRDDEAEADTYGFRWAAEAGYDLQGAVRLFETLEKEHSSGFSFLQDHPINPDRIAKAKGFIEAKNIDLALKSQQSNAERGNSLDAELFQIAANDSQESRQLLEKEASDGNALAQSKLGLILFVGKDEKNKLLGITWLEKAAAQNDSFSQALLGMSYLSGKYVSKDLKVGFNLLRQSAEGGYPFAQFMLGSMYLKGNSVDKDIAESERWFGLAANSNSSLPKSVLAASYLEGKIYKQDVPKALQLFSEAEVLDSDLAQQFTGLIYSNGRLAEKDQKKVFDAYYKLAVKGYPFAMTYLGIALSQGIGVEKNSVESIKWLREAQMNGSKSATLLLAGRSSEIAKDSNAEMNLDIKNSIQNDTRKWIVKLVQERVDSKLESP